MARAFREEAVQFMRLRGPTRKMIESGIRSEEEVNLLLQTILAFNDGTLVTGKFNPRSAKLRRFKKSLRERGLAAVTEEFLASLPELARQKLDESVRDINEGRTRARGWSDELKRFNRFREEDNVEMILTLADIVDEMRIVSFRSLRARGQIEEALRPLGLKVNMTRQEMLKAGFQAQPIQGKDK